LFLEITTYDEKIGDEKGLEFACIKPRKVKAAMLEFSRPHYLADILKVEVPVNMRDVEGTKSNRDDRIAYSREEAMQHFRNAAAGSRVPFIYQSAGVSAEVFRETIELAINADTPFAGVLCGRATWQNGIPAYVPGGTSTLYAWLEDQGVYNIQELNGILSRGARPWWDFYDGKENIYIIEHRSTSR
jgi:tagatose 1,6-diphosphate aldolase